MYKITGTFITLLVSLSALTTATDLNAVPLTGGTAHELERRAAAYNTVHITSTTDYCLVVPKNKHTNIGDSEYPGGETVYCSKPVKGQGQMPTNFWKSVTLAKPKTGVIQLTGCINSSSLDRLNPKDDGGQYDSSGGDGGHGNPAGSVCTGYAHYVELIEPAENRACIRCCQSANDCPTTMDQSGCPQVIKGNYKGCS